MNQNNLHRFNSGDVTGQRINSIIGHTPVQVTSCAPKDITNQRINLLSSLELSRATNQDLEAKLKHLVHQERKLLHLILLHIKEIDYRKLYLKKAYPSLFEYLTKEYGYSAGSAMRRIEAARLLKAVPQMAKQIQSGEINLSQITEISRAIKEKQKVTKKFISKHDKEDLVLKVAGLSLTETQKVVSLELDIKPKEIEKQRTQQDESVRVELTLTKEQMHKLKKCKDLASHLLEQRRMDASMASVLEVLMDQFLKSRGCTATEAVKDESAVGSHSDDKNNKSNEFKKENFISKLEVGSDVNCNHLEERKYSQREGMNIVKEEETVCTKIEKANKTLTPKTKSKIIKRDLCCQYVDPVTKRKCGSTFKLEVDHKKPKWANGHNETNNLQVLCKSHNNFKYKTEANLRLQI